MEVCFKISFYWLLLGGCLLSSFGHEGDGDISYILVEFPEEGQWKATARLDPEAIFLSFEEGWPNDEAYARLANLYWNFENTGSEIRNVFLEAVAKHISFEADGVELPFEQSLLLDPAFDYEPSLGQSMWGLVEFRGRLPERAQRFRVQVPESYYPLDYRVQTGNPEDAEQEFFRPRTGRLLRPFLFESGAFAPREVSGDRANTL